MKISGLIALVVLGCVQRSDAWGFWGHRMINKMACFTLPPELFGFYKENIDFIVVHAVDPDKRRYSDPEEAPRHFIDLDRYGKTAFDSLPQRWNDAVKKVGEDSLKENGIVPWYIQQMYYRLRNAFKEKNKARILYYSACIGHYVGDAHVPLHCTENYNGQLTDQQGIHGFWESRLPELFGDNYDYFVGNALYVDNVTTFSWKIVKASFSALDTVLSFERQLNNSFRPDHKYAFELRGTLPVKVYSLEYATAFHEMLNGQVERRIRAAILAVGSIWYSAWVDAGMPELQNLNVTDLKIPVDSTHVKTKNTFTPCD